MSRSGQSSRSTSSYSSDKIPLSFQSGMYLLIDDAALSLSEFHRLQTTHHLWLRQLRQQVPRFKIHHHLKWTALGILQQQIRPVFQVGQDTSFAQSGLPFGRGGEVKETGRALLHQQLTRWPPAQEEVFSIIPEGEWWEVLLELILLPIGEGTWYRSLRTEAYHMIAACRSSMWQ